MYVSPPPLAPRIGQTQARSIKFSPSFIREIQLGMDLEDSEARSSVQTNIDSNDLTELSNAHAQESDLMYRQLAQEIQTHAASCDEVDLDQLAMASWNLRLVDSAQVLFNDCDSTVMSSNRPTKIFQKNGSFSGT